VAVASQLLQMLGREARSRGIRELLATVRADKPAAPAFHAEAGLRVVGTMQGHLLYRGRSLDQVLAERVLTEPD
jgi:L-amino acid N-acyltransferase YncA